MRTIYSVCFAVGMMFVVGCASTQGPQAGGQYVQKMERQVTERIDYLLFLPAEYGEDDEKKWPLILFLHGAGERGDNIEVVKVHGPPRIVEKDKSFGFIVVSPQCAKNDWWPNRMETLAALLDEVESNYSVDPDRIYVTGLSMGGYGTWSLACRYPERFAAIAPICGGGIPFLARSLKDVGVWAFHGAKDEMVPLEKSKEMVEMVKSIGGQAKLTVYPEARHNSWTAAYNNPELYEWFLKHKKKR